MPGKLHLLVIDDDHSFMSDFRLLSSDYFKTSLAESWEAALDFLAGNEPDAVILDLCLGNGMDGLEILKKIRERYDAMPVIMVTEHASVDTAVEAMKLGAVHYMPKHPNMKALQAIIERELASIQWKTLYKNDVHKQFGTIVGDSPVMKQVFKRIDLVAGTRACILIEGESGTGKELVAREIHNRGPRCDAPFVAVNCAAIPPTLFESELFGHEKGAFTGAVQRKKGKCEYAHNGTLFLDEIASLTPEFQAKFLRVIEDGAFTRLGGNALIEVDLRILSASNKPLAAEVGRGAFREDLFHRINGIDIQVPPLRTRGKDIVRLADFFSKKFGVNAPLEQRLSPAAISAIMKYHWPGNVRELRNVIERVNILFPDRIVEPEDLQLQPGGDPDMPEMVRRVLEMPYDEAKNALLDELRSTYFNHLLKKHNGNITSAAREAKIPRQSYYRLLGGE